MITKSYFVYIITNYKNTTLYLGVTNNLLRRTYEHRQGLVEGFSKRYNLTKLVYFEEFKGIKLAIKREKQIKKWRREKKNILIESLNPTWEDLYKSMVR